ncbi:MAG: tetratricopeptide repeat protein [Thermodesulfobacteriota bacterium]
MEKEFLKIEAKIQRDPYNPLNHISLARAYLEEGNEERARKIIVTKRRLPSKDPSVHFEWGRLCEELGMSRQAVESYEQAIALHPENPEYHFRISLLYYEKGAWERALKHLQKTVSLTPKNQEAKKLLASLYEEMGFKGLSDRIRGEKEKKDFIPKTIPFQLQKEDAFLLFYFREESLDMLNIISILLAI